jgi:hypothetical protein
VGVRFKRQFTISDSGVDLGAKLGRKVEGIGDGDIAKIGGEL